MLKPAGDRPDMRDAKPKPEQWDVERFKTWMCIWAVATGLVGSLIVFSTALFR